MEFTEFSFRYAGVILNEDDFIGDYSEIKQVIAGISDQDLIAQHAGYGEQDILRTPKSLSIAINQLLKNRLTGLGWGAESPIFQERGYTDKRWRLDFAKNDISVEVAFNHAEAIAWNLIKPVLASELNHVDKRIQTKIGIVITATNAMKRIGGFDGAIGTFETFQNYLKPFNGILTVPMLIIGLHPPATFVIRHVKPEPRKTIGEIVML